MSQELINNFYAYVAKVKASEDALIDIEIILLTKDLTEAINKKSMPRFCQYGKPINNSNWANFYTLCRENIFFILEGWYRVIIPLNNSDEDDY